MAESDTFVENVMIGAAVVFFGLSGAAAMRACSTADDIKTAVCVEAYQRAVTATDTLRVHRTTKCDIPQRESSP